MREKILTYPRPQLEHAELLACLLGTGSANESVFELSKRLIQEYGGLRQLLTCPANELIQLKGVGEAKAARLLAARELATEFFKGPAISALTPLADPREVYRRFSHLVFEPQEVLVCAFLDPRLRLLRSQLVFRGSQDAVSIDCREIIRQAIQFRADRILLVHNHPSQDPSPSPADIRTTRLLFKQARWMGIPLLDHVILAAHENYFSFAKSGLLKGPGYRRRQTEIPHFLLARSFQKKQLTENGNTPPQTPKTLEGSGRPEKSTSNASVHEIRNALPRGALSDSEKNMQGTFL